MKSFLLGVGVPSALMGSAGGLMWLFMELFGFAGIWGAILVFGILALAAAGGVHLWECRR